MRLRGVLLVLVGLVVLGLPAGASAEGACPNEGFREAQHATALPDCRAYELVSPPDKLGGDVMGDPTRVRVSASGDAVSFASLQAFGDAIGTGLAVDYIGERGGVAGTNGWATHAITPAQQPFETLGVLSGGWPQYLGDFSDDLSAGVFQSISPVTDAPNVAAAKNLYVRHDLLDAGSVTYQLLSDAVAPVPPHDTGVNSVGYRPFVAGASSDFSHVVFESKLSLTADAVGENPKLYEWVNGAVRLVGVLPDGELATAGCPGGSPCAVAGLGASNPTYTQDVISSDGSRVFFTSPVTGSAGPAPDANLYMRDDHGTADTADDTTVQVNVSERVPAEAPQAAKFGGASKGGSRVFFTSNEQLTNDVYGSGPYLYMYDASKPDSAPDNLSLISVDGEPGDGVGVEGVVGVSDDGTYVYFAATQQLVAGQTTAPGDKLYVWHEGTGVRYIGMLTQTGDETEAVGANYKLGPKTARVTPDGGTLVFTSRSGDGLTGYDHGSGCGTTSEDPCSEVYVYSTAANGGAGRLVCASCNPSGAAAKTDASTYMKFGLSGGTPNSHLNQAVSDDGKRVFFTSGERLVPGDLNNARDVYEYDTVTGELHLISSGRDAVDSYFMAVSPSGDDVFFITHSRLLGWDVDDSYDLYDARIGGGLPEPAPVSAECVGDGCQSPAAGAAGGVGPGSAVVAGAGNVVAAPGVVRPVVRSLTSAQKLTRALRACRKLPKRRRRGCESRARGRYGKKAIKSGRAK